MDWLSTCVIKSLKNQTFLLMKRKILFLALLAMVVFACKQHPDGEPGHDAEASHTEHGSAKFQYTAYSEHFEVFAETDAFVAGEPANILAHFSYLNDFKPVEDGKITLILTIEGKETRVTLNAPTRKGIYSFDLKPLIAGRGAIRFEIARANGTFRMELPDVTVFSNDGEAVKAAEAAVVPKTNTAVFTKEQSWKIDFATAAPLLRPFGPVIRTTARIQPPPGSEMVVTAKTNGLVVLTSNSLLEGSRVSAGQVLCSITGGNLANDNISVRYAEAKSNYEKALADYERIRELAKDKIVAGKDLLAAQNQYENARAVFDNLKNNFTGTGQSVTSPMSGFIRQVMVKNGMFVEAGQPVAIISQNKFLVISADIPLRYASVLGAIQSANIRNCSNDKIYTLEELNGKILSAGQMPGADNFLIPLNLQIDNAGDFVSGGFVDLYLKTVTDTRAMVVPNIALLEEQGNYFVWVQINPELFEKREVRVGGTDGIYTQISSGITPDERIVTRGAVMVKLAQATGSLDAHSGHVH